MKTYSIVRIGTEYVVQAGEKSILKVATRRRAARLVSDAKELLDTHAAPQLSPQAHVEPSIVPDAGGTPDPRDMPDPEVVSDPEVMPDPPDC
jgi:hypothetical protein